MDKPTFSDLEYQGKKRKTRRELFLERMDGLIPWQSNLEVQREMRRDIKRELRESGDYTEEQLYELANRIVELSRRRDGR